MSSKELSFWRCPGWWIISLHYINFQITWTCGEFLFGVSVSAVRAQCHLSAQSRRPSCPSGFDNSVSRESFLCVWSVVLTAVLCERLDVTVCSMWQMLAQACWSGSSLYPLLLSASPSESPGQTSVRAVGTVLAAC